MMRRRGRPLRRAAMVGGVAYHAGKRGQEDRASLEEQYAAPAAAATPAGGSTAAVIDQLEKLAELKDAGVLTQDEFDDQKRRLLQSA